LKDKCRNILVLGECHAAVFNGLLLYNMPYCRADKLSEDVLSGVDAVIVTSPDAYGATKDIETIRKLIGQRLLLVDEAHGAHYAFCSLLPVSAVKYADITVNSMHKTMPVYTGGALLHSNNAELDSAIITYRRMAHSTSPSYLVMATMDYARALFLENGELMYKEVLEAIEKLELPIGYTRILNDDFSRLVLSTGNRGKEVYQKLSEAGIYLEMYDNDRVVFIVTPFNRELLGKVEEVLKRDIIVKASNNNKDKYLYLEGKIAKEDIGLYPPCVPVILKGEVITRKKIEYVIENIERAYGLRDEN
ncbi:MAG: hypothetical protein EOM87_05995, partial [Clostridia bacterium]|nr:hypothetical protein [Clostridia bacterium]